MRDTHTNHEVAVLLERLKTTRDGLSSTEAALRFDTEGPHQLPTPERRTIRLSLLLRPELLLGLAAGIFALTQGAMLLGLIVVTLAVIGLATQAYKQSALRYTHLHKQLGYLLHPVARVVRDGVESDVLTSSLVVGDVVYLSKDFPVPADLQLIEVRKLVLDDSFYNGNPSSNTPIVLNANPVFAATNIVSGHGYGVVTATASHTRLAQLLVHASRGKTPQTPTEQYLDRIATKLAWTAIGIVIALGLCTVFSALPADALWLTYVAIVLACLPYTLRGAVIVGLVTAGRTLQKLGTSIANLWSLVGLGSVTRIAMPRLDLMHPHRLSSALVGRNYYHVLAATKTKALQFSPVSGGKTTADQRKSLAFLSEAYALSGGKHVSVVETHAAAQSKIISYTPNGDHALTSAVQPYDQDGRLHLFVHGAVEDVLAHATHIWDHGHERKMTPADRAFIRAFSHDQADIHEEVMGVAYRQLPKQVEPSDKNRAKLETNLVWLGKLGTLQAPLLSKTAALLANQLGLTISDTATQKTALLGFTADDIPTMQHHTSIAFAARSPRIATIADIRIVRGGFDAVVTATERGRTLIAAFSRIFSVWLVGRAAQVAVLACSSIALAYWNVPVAIMGVHILIMAFILELPILAALSQDKPEHGQNLKLSKRFGHADNTAGEIIWNGILIAGLAVGNYMLFFSRNHISPSDVSSGIPIHLQAMAIVLVTLVLCQWVNAVLSRSKNGLFSRQQLTNPSFWFALLIGVLWLLLLVYTPSLSSSVQLGSLELVDWAWALFAAGIFLVVRQFQIYDRRHHRAAVHALHRATAKR